MDFELVQTNFIPSKLWRDRHPDRTSDWQLLLQESALYNNLIKEVEMLLSELIQLQTIIHINYYLMQEQPILTSDRLLLRPFTLSDVSLVQDLAGKREIADTTISIPHPYSLSQAQEWISTHPEEFARGKAVHFAIECKEIQQLIGAIALRDIEQEHQQGELGYWIGVEFWGQGYASEAARTAIAYGFEVLHLHRIYAYHMTRNPASGRILHKLGMRQEGLLRDRTRKWGIFEDVLLYGILEEEWHKHQGNFGTMGS